MQESQGKSIEGSESINTWKVAGHGMRRGCREAWKSGWGSGAREKARKKSVLSSVSVCMELSWTEMGNERGRACLRDGRAQF